MKKILITALFALSVFGLNWFFVYQSMSETKPIFDVSGYMEFDFIDTLFASYELKNIKGFFAMSFLGLVVIIPLTLLLMSYEDEIYDYLIIFLCSGGIFIAPVLPLVAIFFTEIVIDQAYEERLGKIRLVKKFEKRINTGSWDGEDGIRAFVSEKSSKQPLSDYWLAMVEGMYRAENAGYRIDADYVKTYVTRLRAGEPGYADAGTAKNIYRLEKLYDGKVLSVPGKAYFEKLNTANYILKAVFSLSLIILSRQIYAAYSRRKRNGLPSLPN